MPSQRKSLQQEGVPIPDKLAPPMGPKRQSTTRRWRDPDTGLVQQETVVNERPGQGSQARERGQGSAPREPGKRGGGGGGSLEVPSIGMLMGEFFFCIALLILIFFTSSGSYATKAMSTVKRGALTCLAFFILSLIAAIGPRAAKISKAFGALIVIAILLTAPVGTGLTDIDNIFKNDWAGQSPQTNTVTPPEQAPSSNNPTGSVPGSTSLGSSINSAINGFVSGLTGVTGNPTGVSGQVKNFLQGLFGGILGSLLWQIRQHGRSQR